MLKMERSKGQKEGLQWEDSGQASLYPRNICMWMLTV